MATIDQSGLATAVSEGTVRITVAAGSSTFGWADLVVAAVPLRIVTADLRPGVVGLEYDAVLGADGVGAQAVWSISGGALPSGLTLDASNGTLRGTPQAVDTSSFSVTLVSAGQTFTRELTLVIAPADFGVGFADDQFAYVPAGSFQMGSAQGSKDEQPVHTVNITRPFLLQKTEVTQQQWETVIGYYSTSYPNCGPTCPVDLVTWSDVLGFLRKLNEMDPGKNYRLPTEAEWEYAARAGSEGAFGGTGMLDDMGWYDGNSGNRVHFVAQKTPNAWGLYDMHGNVAEWVQDYYSPTYYAVSPSDDPKGPALADSERGHRVIRGGTAQSSGYYVRSASRSRLSPEAVYALVGLRIVRDPS